MRKIIALDYVGPDYCRDKDCPMFEPEIHTDKVYAEDKVLNKFITVRCEHREVCEKIMRQIAEGKIQP